MGRSGVFRLFRQVSLREHRTHWGRALLVVAGVATGIALVVAIDIINTSVLASFERTFAALAGPADLEVALGTGEVGFDEEIAEVVRRDPAVALAVPLVRGTISLGSDASETLQLFGAELTAEEDLARYGVQLASDRQSALAALEDPHAILIADALAARLGLSVGSSLTLSTPRGLGTFTIRGLLAAEGVARVLGGQLAVLDIAAAQTELVKTGRIDQLDIVLRPGVDSAAARARLQAAIPATLTVGTPLTRATRYADILIGLQMAFNGLSMIAVLAGLFIVYNATATGVVHRARVIGALRLIGGNARQLRAMLLTESVALGAVGAIAGAILGIILARFLVILLGTVMGTMVQMRFIVAELSLRIPRQAAIATIGVAVAFCAAWFPARQATRLEPLAVARGVLSGPTRVPIRTLAIVWAALVAISAAMLVGGERSGNTMLSAFGSTMWNGSGLVGAVAFVGAFAGVFSRWLPRLFGVTGKVAAANLVRMPVRSGVTVAAIALVTTLTFTLGDVTASYLATAAAYITEMHDGDLTVSAVATEGGWLETPLAPEIAAEIGRMPGVRAVETARIVPGQEFRGGRIGLLALMPDALARLGPSLWRAGDRIRGRQALAAGEAVVVSTVFSERFAVGIGDPVALETPKGPLTLPIAGIVSEMSSNSGTVILSGPLYEKWWSDPSVSRINVYLDGGITIEDARRRIVAQLGDRYRLKILGLRDNLAYHEDKIRRAFGFVNTLQLLLAIVTVAGVFDLLLSGIIERRHELAAWRLMGADERAVRRTIVVESVTLGALAVVIGFALGIVSSLIWVRLLIPRLIGYDLTFAFAPLPTALGAVLVLLMTALAGWAAAARATRASVLLGMRAD